MAVIQMAADAHRNFSVEPGADDHLQSALARGVQITEFQETKVNPEPVVIEESDILLESFLSPTKLQFLTGVDNLDDVKSLELKVDTAETSLGNFGSLLPNLSQLKLFNSNIPCIRDLGSSLRKLEVLWLSRSGLQELDGIFSMSSLKELYLSFNEISDITAVSMLEELKILDLEGNDLDDIFQVNYLAMCPKLTDLTLEDNPICLTPHLHDDDPSYNYRQAVKTAIPHLKYLDGEPLVEGEELLMQHNVFDEHWAFIEKLTKDGTICDPVDGSVSDDTDSCQAGSTSFRPSSQLGYRPESVLQPSSSYRPMTASQRRPATTGGKTARPSTARPRTANKQNSQDQNNIEDAASDLTLGKVICGNPSRALLTRHKQDETSSKVTTDKKLFSQYRHMPEHTYDPVPDEDRDRSEILDELKSWRQQHEKRMEKVRESRYPQVLVINQDESFSLSGDSESEDSDFEQMEHDVQSQWKQDKTNLSQSHSLEWIEKDKKDSENAEGITFSKMQGTKHDESFDAIPETTIDNKQTFTNNIVKGVRTVCNSMTVGGDPVHQTLAQINPHPPPARPFNLNALRSQSPIPSRLINDSRVLPSPPGGRSPQTSNDIDSKILLSSGTTRPVIRGMGESLGVNVQRPYTARAALGLLAQPRIRRSLPQVPSLPSKPSVLK